jgi:hypothetical protein
LALRLKVFIASPSDVLPERDIAYNALVGLQAEYAAERLLIEPYRWEGRVPPTLRGAQSLINVQLRTAELTIAIFWSTLGTVARATTGSIEEYTITSERVSRGYADDVFLYFKTSAPERQDAATEAVREFKEKIRRIPEIFAARFETPEEFRDRIQQDLRSWLNRWIGTPQVCAYALAKTPGGMPPAHVAGENRLARLKQRFDPWSCPDIGWRLAAASIRMYQEQGPQAALTSLSGYIAEGAGPAAVFGRPSSHAGYQQLLDAGVLESHGRQMRFTNEEWFYVYCAWGLVQALRNRDVAAVERRPYINPIHQYLQAICSGHEREEVIQVLRSWLVNADGVTQGKPIVRNFAAYVLGMLNAIDAHEDLARMIQEDPGEDVRMYCVASLGRMRARVQLPALVELFQQAQDEPLRLMAAQAVSRMIGIADYPM